MNARSKPITALVLTGLLSLGGFAAAHSTKEKTYPADGASLASAPTTIGMTFDMPMRITMIKVIDANGAEFEVERTDGMASVTEFQAGAPLLQPGKYNVEWRGLADDGHAMSGSFAFTIED